MFKLFWANKVTVDGSLQSWAQRRIKLPAIPLIGEEQRTQLSIPWKGLSSPYLDPHGSSLPKGGTRTWNVRLAIILSHYLAFLQANSGGPCFRSLLMPSHKQTLGTDVEPTTSTWGHMAACWVLPPAPGSTRERWFPACPMTAKALRLCFLQDCIWTRIILINPPNKEFLKQKFQYNEAQGGDGAVLRTRHWRLWVTVSGLLLSNSGFLMV